MKISIYKILWILLSFFLVEKILFSIPLTHAVTDSYDFLDASHYSLSDSDDIYIHNDTVKLKGSLQSRGHIDNGPQAFEQSVRVEIDGNYAYVASYGGHGITAVDISNPANMTQVGFIGADSYARIYGIYDMQKVGNYIYTANYIADSLIVIDASDPTNLQYAGRLNNSSATKLNGARALEIRGNYAYIASYIDHALQIIDISNPTNPVAVSYIQDTVNLRNAVNIDVEGNYAYITSYSNDHMQIVDISDPTNPVLAGKIIDNAVTELNGAWGIEVEGNYAYIASLVDDGLEIIDVSDPNNPIHAGEIQNSDPGIVLNGARDLKVVGNYAYISSYYDDALQIIDISDPVNPIGAGYLDTNQGRLDSTFGIDVSGTNVFMTSYTNATLQSIDTSDVSSPVFQGEISSGPTRLGNPFEILVDGDYAYVAGYGSSSLEILDISDSSNPQHVGAIQDNRGVTEFWGAWGIEKKGNYVYISGYSDSGMQVIDVSNPATPVAVKKIPYSAGDIELNRPRGMYINGNYLFVVSYIGDTLQIFDINNPDDPIALGFVKDNTRLNGANDVVVKGNYAYVSSYARDNISVIDISNPNAPSYITELRNMSGRELNGSWSLDIYENTLIVSSYIDHAIVSIDISDPTSPQYVNDFVDTSETYLRYPRGIKYDEGYAYVSTYGNDSILVFDVSDPENLLFIDQIRDVRDYDTSSNLDKKENDIFFTQYLGSSMSTIREVYPSNSPSVTALDAISSNYFNSISANYGKYNEGSVSFQLSKDNGSSWYYFDGSSWSPASNSSQSNSTGAINANISGFNSLSGSDKIVWKAFLHSDGTQKVELDTISIDYADISAPIIENISPDENSLLPKHDFSITLEYFDTDGAYGTGGVTQNNGGIGIDTSSYQLELFKWDGVGSWGSDISGSFVNFSGATIGTGSASFPTQNLGFGKYKADVSIADLNGNRSLTESRIFYIDEPEFIISHAERDIGLLSTGSTLFSPEIIVQVKTVGAAFNVNLLQNQVLRYAGLETQDWDGNIGYGYELAPYADSISPLLASQNIASQSGSINTQGAKNTYSFPLRFGARSYEGLFGGDYEGLIDFSVHFDY